MHRNRDDTDLIPKCLEPTGICEADAISVSEAGFKFGEIFSAVLNGINGCSF